MLKVKTICVFHKNPGLYSISLILKEIFVVTFAYTFALGDQGTSVQILSGITGTRGRGGDLQRRACDQNCPTCTSADFSPEGDAEG